MRGWPTNSTWLLPRSSPEIPILRFVGLLTRRPGPGEILIHIHAAGLNPVNRKVAGGALKVPLSSGPPTALTRHAWLLPKIMDPRVPQESGL
jgi:hypothetical protein